MLTPSWANTKKKTTGGLFFTLLVLVCLLQITPKAAGRSFFFRRKAMNIFTQKHNVRQQRCQGCKLPICLGILAYQGDITLNQTLQSYEDSGLFDLTTSAYIHFQKVDSDARKEWMEGVLSKYQNLKPSFSHSNIEFAAFLKLAKKCQQAYFLPLEEDFQISTENFKILSEQLRTAVDMLKNGVKAVYLRSRSKPGSPDYARQAFEGGYLGQQHLFEHTTWNYHAESEFSEINSCRKSPKYWCSTSRHAPFTNNPTLYTTELYLRLMSVGSPDLSFSRIEPVITEIWGQQDLIVARSEGVFTHLRVDRTMS